MTKMKIDPSITNFNSEEVNVKPGDIVEVYPELLGGRPVWVDPEHKVIYPLGCLVNVEDN